MKRQLSLALCFLSLAAVALADPATEVDEAIAKVLSASNFKWTAMWEQRDPAARYRYEGQTEPLGMTVVTTDRHALPLSKIRSGDSPIVIAFAGDRCVLCLDGEWLTTHEYAEANGALHSFLPELAAALPSGQRVVESRVSTIIPTADGTRTTTDYERRYTLVTPGYTYLPRPDLLLRMVWHELSAVKSDGRTITAEISERAIRELFELRLAVPFVDPGGVGMGGSTGHDTGQSQMRRGRTPAQTRFESSQSAIVGPAPDRRAGVGNRDTLMPGGGQMPRERYENLKGRATFWVSRDALLKFELQLESVGYWGSRPEGIPHDVTITLNLEAGTSPMSVPSGAREKMATF